MFSNTRKRILNRLLLLVLLNGLCFIFACAPQTEPAETTATAAAATEAPPTPTQEPTPLPTPSYKGPVSRVEGKQFLVRNESGEFEQFFVKGVDIGAAKPGYWPGEFGIPLED